MATTRRPRTISFDVPSRRTQSDSIEYSSSVTGGFHQVLDFAPPTLQRRPSSLILTPKAGGKLQWEFPPGSDTATTAVNLTSIECNACSPPATPIRDTERLNCPRWDANPSPLMVPKIERRLSLSATEVTKTPLISIVTFSDTEEDFTSTEVPNKPELHSYRHLSQSYGTLPKRKSVIFPIDYSAPENIIALSKALELSPIKLVGREEDTTPVLSTELGSEVSAMHAPQNFHYSFHKIDYLASITNSSCSKIRAFLEPALQYRSAWC
ncbi:oxidation resistance protein 1, variant 2 [Basidiobolus ranarum]|uniref:Oxidation resistance protein 1, variant 2 n=1 Tax=Basidiobolus ranarum TaxID=34480 RepID=A0ABR2WG68_9FUNG